MELKFKVAARIARPVHDVFEAVADPEQLSNYFTTGGAKGRLETGATVTWDFHDFPGAFPVEVVEVVPDERIVLRWAAHEEQGASDGGSDSPKPDYKTKVTMTFTPLDDNKRTLVEIAEEGWRETEAGLKGSYGNCMGWSQMLCALKVWIEHGINLRAVGRSRLPANAHRLLRAAGECSPRPRWSNYPRSVARFSPVLHNKRGHLLAPYAPPTKNCLFNMMEVADFFRCRLSHKLRAHLKHLPKAAGTQSLSPRSFGNAMDRRRSCAVKLMPGSPSAFFWFPSSCIGGSVGTHSPTMPPSMAKIPTFPNI